MSNHYKYKCPILYKKEVQRIVNHEGKLQCADDFMPVLNAKVRELILTACAKAKAKKYKRVRGQELM